MDLQTQLSTTSNQFYGGAIDTNSFFWQQWLQHQGTLLRCCIKWMGGEPNGGRRCALAGDVKSLGKGAKVRRENQEF